MIYWWGIKYFKNIVMFHMQISQDDVGIAFKLHDFVQMTFYHLCENFAKPSFT